MQVLLWCMSALSHTHTHTPVLLGKCPIAASKAAPAHTDCTDIAALAVAGEQRGAPTSLIEPPLFLFLPDFEGFAIGVAGPPTLPATQQSSTNQLLACKGRDLLLSCPPNELRGLQQVFVDM